VRLAGSKKGNLRGEHFATGLNILPSYRNALPFVFLPLQRQTKIQLRFIEPGYQKMICAHAFAKDAKVAAMRMSKYIVMVQKRPLECK
jgi:hypothetical protein